MERFIVFRELRGVIQHALNVGAEAAAGSNDTYADAVFVQIGEIASNKSPQKTKEITDFLGWARPILGGEAEERKVRDAEVSRCFDDPANGFHASPVSLDPRQASLRGPSAVAIHDDGDMGRAWTSLVTPLVVHYERHSQPLRSKLQMRPYAGPN
jgi:hypothetical protein